MLRSCNFGGNRPQSKVVLVFRWGQCRTVGSMGAEAEKVQTSRARLIAAGKSLFARLGYEQTSTAAIAREAGTSESQLVRYFDGKLGLLGSIFEESWKPLNEKVQTLIANATNAREAVLHVLSAMIGALARDPELAFLFLLEGRRVRGAHELVMSKGAVQFSQLIRHLIQRGQKDGSFSKSFNDVAVASALVGLTESMIRDRLIAERSERTSPFSEREIHRVFSAMLGGLCTPRSDQ